MMYLFNAISIKIPGTFTELKNNLLNSQGRTRGPDTMEILNRRSNVGWVIIPHLKSYYSNKNSATSQKTYSQPAVGMMEVPGSSPRSCGHLVFENTAFQKHTLGMKAALTSAAVWEMEWPSHLALLCRGQFDSNWIKDTDVDPKLWNRRETHVEHFKIQVEARYLCKRLLAQKIISRIGKEFK